MLVIEHHVLAPVIRGKGTRLSLLGLHIAPAHMHMPDIAFQHAHVPFRMNCQEMDDKMDELMANLESVLAFEEQFSSRLSHLEGVVGALLAGKAQLRSQMAEHSGALAKVEADQQQLRSDQQQLRSDQRQLRPDMNAMYEQLSMKVASMLGTVNTVAMRAMLNTAHQKIVESGVVAHCRMDAWNSDLDAMTDNQLQQLGLTRAAVNEKERKSYALGHELRKGVVRRRTYPHTLPLCQ